MLHWQGPSLKTILHALMSGGFPVPFCGHSRWKSKQSKRSRRRKKAKRRGKTVRGPPHALHAQDPGSLAPGGARTDQARRVTASEKTECKGRTKNVSISFHVSTGENSRVWCGNEGPLACSVHFLRGIIDYVTWPIGYVRGREELIWALSKTLG